MLRKALTSKDLNQLTFDNFVRVEQNIPNNTHLINQTNAINLQIYNNRRNGLNDQSHLQQNQNQHIAFSKALLDKIIPESKEIAKDISSHLKKEEGNYLP